MKTTDDVYQPKDPFLWKVMECIPKGAGVLGCLVIVLCCIPMIPFVPFWFLRRCWRVHFFRKALAKQNRRISWPNFQERLSESAGTVIVEVGNKRPTRFWWTTDEILSIAPMEPPEFSELNWIAYGGEEYHPFARWCYEHYISLDSGKAFLVYPVEADFETFPHAEDFDEQMRARFPDCQVVVVTFYDVRYA